MSGTSSRCNPRMGDILRSVGLLGLILVTLFGVGKLLTVTPDEPTHAIDYRSAVESSRKVSDFELLAPTRLPQGWRATSVRFDPNAWHLGVLTADDDYVGLEQVRIAEKRAIERFAQGSRAAGTAAIDGVTWSRRSGPGNDSTYLRRVGDVTILVTGTAPRGDVERYVSSLSPS